MQEEKRNKETSKYHKYGNGVLQRQSKKKLKSWRC